MDKNQEKIDFPLTLNYDIYNFKPYEILNAEQLNVFQQNIGAIFDILEKAINLINSKVSYNFAELIGYKGPILSIDPKDSSKVSLETLQSATSGDIYLLKDSSFNIKEFNSKYNTSFKENDLLLCAYDYNFEEISSGIKLDYNQIWSSKRNLLEAATENKSGLITNHLQYITGLKAFLDGFILRGSTLDVDVSSIKLMENGILKELPNFGELKAIKDNIEYLLENVTMRPITNEEINSLFL